jgi:hypothetical protein
MLFQLVQIIYWIALSMWFGGALFVCVAAPVIHRTVMDNKPILPHVLSVNLENKHGTLLAGTIISNLMAAVSEIEMLCAALLLIVLSAQWFMIDLSDNWLLISAILRSALYIAAVTIVVYEWRSVWPKILRFRQTYIDNADDPEKANPASEEFDRLQRESDMLLQVLVGLLLAMILLSGNLSLHSVTRVKF